MTLQEAKSIARHLGFTLRKVRSGDYRAWTCPVETRARPITPVILKTQSVPQSRWPASDLWISAVQSRHLIWNHHNRSKPN